jgi:1-acyl-sn-glycerol-3-phosphate acyltransferase
VSDLIHELAGRSLCGLVNLFCGTASRWVDCQPSSRQRIYYGNHTSHLDLLTLWSALPLEVRRVTRPAAARDYWETTSLRRYLVHKVFNAIMVDRARPGGSIAAAAQSLEAVLDGMGDRYSLIIFPEGTRGTGENIAPFKSGIYHMAKRKPDIELVPVFMENLNRILPKGEILPIPLISSISFGKPLTLDRGESKILFLQRARQAILDLAKA